MTRDDKGRFKKGVSGNPGGRVAPAADSARLLRDALSRKLTDVEAESIIDRMITDAKRGNSDARKHLFAMVGIDLNKINVDSNSKVEITVRYGNRDTAS